ncbi:IS3 family transposase [Bacillus cereus]|uniref:IS3 family transposase n=1 Tax=Bacillus cereus TaxID=1396 RepID=A0A9W7UWM9_BACCE|nr:IS3 family transposase [Bacillus cereus]KAB2408112.1 IS3 family transposase [Bacillus cereus]KAB2430929.1 IS3 family transposase [Bacillus cereus]
MFTYRNRLLKKVKGLRSKRDGITEQDKAKVIYLTKFESIEHIKIVLDNYTGHYNRKKIKVQLKGMSPVQYRTHLQTAA